jgi:hypothetical protein
MQRQLAHGRLNQADLYQLEQTLTKLKEMLHPPLIQLKLEKKLQLVSPFIHSVFLGAINLRVGP